ncbi:MAG: TolC family protein [Ilyomonas sp.]
MKRFILIVILIICYKVQAQELLSAHDAVNIALKNSLDIQLAKNDLEVNRVLNNYGVAGGLPSITGSASDNESLTSVNQKLNTGTVIQRSGTFSNNLNGNITAGILLFNGYRVVATKKRLEELQKQSEYAVNAQIQNVIASVLTGYYDIVRQQDYLKTINISIDVAQKKLAIVQTQQSVGMANNADLFQAQLDLNTLQQTKQSQLLVIDQAKTELLRLMTLKPDSLISIKDTILVDRNLKLDEVLSNLSANPDVLFAGEQIKINEQIVRETAAQRYPSVRATTGYNYTRNQTAAGNVLFNQNYGPTIGLSLSVPIYNGSAYKRQQRAAEINVNSAEIERQTLLRDYSAGAVKNYHAFINNLNQLETEQKNFLLAQQLLDLVYERFKARVATIVDFTLAQQTFQESAYRLVNLNFAAKAAEIELKRLANALEF